MPVIVATGEDTFKFIDDGRPQAGAENYTYYDSASEAPEEIRKIVESPRNANAPSGTYGSTVAGPGTQAPQAAAAPQAAGAAAARSTQKKSAPSGGIFGGRLGGGTAQPAGQVFNPSTGTVTPQKSSGLMAQGAANLERELARRKAASQRVTPAYIEPTVGTGQQRLLIPTNGISSPAAPTSLSPAAPATLSKVSKSTASSSPTYSQIWAGGYGNTPAEDAVALGQTVSKALSESPAGVVVRLGSAAANAAGRAIGQGATGVAESVAASPPRGYMVEPIETLGWAQRQIEAGKPSQWLDPNSGQVPSYLNQGTAAVKGVTDQVGGTVTQVLPNLARPAMDAGAAAVGQASSAIATPYRLGRTAVEMIAADPVAAIQTGVKLLTGQDRQYRETPVGRPAPESAYLYENAYSGTPDFAEGRRRAQEADMTSISPVMDYVLQGGDVGRAPTPGYETLTAGYGGSGGSDYPYLDWRRPYGGPMPGDPYAEGPQQGWSSNAVDRYRALQGAVTPVVVPPYNAAPQQSTYPVTVPDYTPKYRTFIP